MKRIFLDKRFRAVAIMILSIGLIMKISQNFGTKEMPEVVTENTKIAEVVVFGEWMPNSSREILGIVVRQNETDVSAEVVGTIEKTFVRIGDSVKKNQILATYRKFDDLTQISYENALRSLNTTKIATQNSTRSAEIALDTAIQELKQTRSTQQQSRTKVFDELKTRARNSETVFNNSLNWADRILGASSKHRYTIDAMRRSIGKNDSINQQEVKNEIENLVRKTKNAIPLPSDATETEILEFAEMRISFLESIKLVAWGMDNLIRNTVLSSSLSSTNRATFQTESESFLSKIDGEILALSSAIEAAKSIDETTRQAVLTAENRVETLRAGLELARSSGDSQLSSIQNQLALASSSRNNLEIRSPFAGRIFFKDITAGRQVKIGQKLFSITNDDSVSEVEAFLSADELTAKRTVTGVKIKFTNGTTIEPVEILVAAKLDVETQKFKTIFRLPEDEETKNITSGSFAKIFIPTQNGHKNLLPVSAFSFEPDGTEVLILDDENILRRQKVQIGKIITDSVEVLDGLDLGVKVTRFRNRFYAGQEVVISN